MVLWPIIWSPVVPARPVDGKEGGGHASHAHPFLELQGRKGAARGRARDAMVEREPRKSNSRVPFFLYLALE